MVVKQRELLQCQLQRRFGRNHELAQQRFECAKQALHTPVLPRGTGLDTLVANAHQFQKRSEHQAGKHPFVVGAQALGLTLL